MKKNVKFLAVIAIVALLALSWYTLISDSASQNKEYESYLENARKKKEDKYYADANDYYQAALEMNDSIKLRKEIADFYYNTDNYETYIGFCRDCITAYPHDSFGYESLVKYFSEKKCYTDCFEILREAERRNIVTDEITKIKNEIQYEYEVEYAGYEKVEAFSAGICIAKLNGGNWGFLSESGKKVLSFNYDFVTAFNGEYMTVKKGEEPFSIINREGRLKSFDHEEKEIQTCGFLMEGKIPVKYGNKYHYCNFDFKELFGSYDYAGAFSCGVAAVKDGDKWIIINSDGKQIGQKTYSEIKVDERGIAFRNNVCFAKDGDKYILIDVNGNRVGNGEWKDVDTFRNAGPAAVSNGKQWGYVGSDGKMVVDYKYDEAKSFSNGFGAVCIDAKWGFISERDFEVKIQPFFKEVNYFGSTGTVFVKNDNGWDLLKLYSFN